MKSLREVLSFSVLLTLCATKEMLWANIKLIDFLGEFVLMVG